MQSMHAFAIDTNLHFNTSMSIAIQADPLLSDLFYMHKINSVCNRLKDYVHV